MIATIDELETVFDIFTPPLEDGSRREMRLRRMDLLLSHLGHPERSFRAFHVAGSKGKGSVSAYLAALLEGSGRKCGLYTSPHLFTIRERFTLSGRFFPDSLYIDVCNDLLEAVSRFIIPSGMGPGKPTVFEMYTAYGYMLFRAAGCTDAVIETGLGGRLDATNTIEPEAVFLTTIELEHTDVLGSTIPEIAREKAGIMREGIPAFVSYQKDSAASDVFRKEAERINAPIAFLSSEAPDLTASTARSGEHTRFTIDGRHYDLVLSMCTKAMAGNAALAVLGASRLSFLTEEGLSLMERVQLPGRFERRIVNDHLLVIDTAHTPASAASSRDAFIAIKSSPSPVLILGIVSGKDMGGIVGALLPAFGHIIITRPGHYRKSDPEKLFQLASELFPEKDITLIEDPDAALDSALAFSSDILITGSFYLAGAMGRLKNES